MFLDVPVPNDEGTALARDLGLDRRSRPHACTGGPAPDLRLDRVVGITTFELG